MSLHLTKTDNASIANKIFLRKEATKTLKHLKVLDLYAGKNTLWKDFEKEKYFGVDIEPLKGKNLTADSKRIISSINLAEFNVIDCDSYGMPFDIIYKILNNKTLQKGTVIIFTAITNRLSGLNKECLKMFNLERFYKRCRNVISSKALELFYAMLERQGIKEIYYYEVIGNFTKNYGYFVVN